MFSSSTINLVILLAFTYFLVSLMVSAINEAVLTMLNRRADYLKKALKGLFENKGWEDYINGNLKTEAGFFDSTHIKSLFKMNKRSPSYIPFQNFLLTLIEYVGADSYKNSFETAINSSDKLNPVVKKALKDIIAKSKSRISENINGLKAFEEELEQYYNNAMDRATGWYKRETGIVLFILALVLSVALNIDTIKIANDGLKDPKKLDIAAESISRFVQDNQADVLILANGDSISINKKQPEATETTGKDIKGQSMNADSVAKADSTISQTKQKVAHVSDLYTSVSGYRFGYNDGGFCTEWGTNFFLKCLGILITCFALQLGSQFWFDTLNKMVNLRSTGKKPVERSDEK
ncbi:MAG: hypothetical protein KF862_00120 [Chitinophagaceae bacterium]|nr:hypothetical protein [Chitinophagaceae bacterium]